ERLVWLVLPGRHLAEFCRETRRDADRDEMLCLVGCFRDVAEVNAVAAMEWRGAAHPWDRPEGLFLNRSEPDRLDRLPQDLATSSQRRRLLARKIRPQRRRDPL